MVTFSYMCKSGGWTKTIAQLFLWSHVLTCANHRDRLVGISPLFRRSPVLREEAAPQKSVSSTIGAPYNVVTLCDRAG